MIFLTKNKLFRKWLLKKSLNKASIITGDSKEIINKINEMIGESNKISRINFGVETDYFKPIKVKCENSEKQILKIISLRNLEPVYDIICLIKALRKLRLLGHKFTCDIYGYGSQELQILNLIEKYSLNNFVKLKGRYDASLLPNILSKYDVYVSTSKADSGIAASTAEAMSCGIPVVISDSAENSYWIDDKKNGFLYKTSNIDELAKALILFEKLDIHLKRQIGLAGRK